MVLNSEVEDSLILVNDNKREFTVKKLTSLLINDGGDDINFAFEKIWNIKAPLRVQNFLWFLAIGRIPIKDFLAKRGM